ncbi:hypothetical protein J3459_011939 [Metarhizium acridum]|uniref:uncharacterized protein n=1 Tax=Metarhizium acridum TaxID=92637 RepID=UPI001C6C9728|nr:hypothetical protein J3458_022192 [Metarhizium acridum]KAG8418883.1 hypothetical protein J3459_011939 [Metarhizium acridum]
MAGPASPAPTTQGASSETPSSNTDQNSSPGPGKVGLRSKYVPRACLECRRRRVKVGLVFIPSPTLLYQNVYEEFTELEPSVTAQSQLALDAILAKYHVSTTPTMKAVESPKSRMCASCKVGSQVLWLHSINVHASTAQLMQQNLVPATITSLTVAQLLPWTDSVIRLRTLWPLMSRKALTRTERHVISARPVVDVASSRSMVGSCFDYPNHFIDITNSAPRRASGLAHGVFAAICGLFGPYVG